ncbi:MAG: outer membrane lipoprotein chaperone LolA [Cellvibrionaceae bacterium]|nr:outer membrane lipoprotein chaperone LolA [Cellvibrionaceae bacterium]
MRKIKATFKAMFKTTSLAVLLCLWAPLASAGEGIPNSAAEQLQSTLAKLKTLEGEFVQTLFAEDGEQLQDSQGYFWLNRQGQYRWETQQPFAQLLIGDREQVVLYDPDLEQMNRRSLNDSERQTPLFLLSGSVSDLAELYEVSQDKSGFVLKPKASNQQAGFVSMNMAIKQGVVEQIKVLDGLGQTTQIQLLSSKLNQPIDPAKFVFSPPAGTDIIDEG